MILPEYPHLQPVLEERAWENTKSYLPELAEAILGELRLGHTPADLGRKVLAETADPELARRVELAARAAGRELAAERNGSSQREKARA